MASLPPSPVKKEQQKGRTLEHNSSTGSLFLLSELQLVFGQDFYTNERSPTHQMATSGPASNLRTCANCRREESASLTLRDCAGCKALGYCDRRCQRAHWPTHKPLCKKMVAVRAGGVDPERLTELAPRTAPVIPGLDERQRCDWLLIVMASTPLSRGLAPSTCQQCAPLRYFAICVSLR